MKKIQWLLICLMCLCSQVAVFAEITVAGIVLPDPLEMRDGTKITTPEQWYELRRPEIISLLEENIYGKWLPDPTTQTFDLVTKEFANCTRVEVTITTTGPYGSNSFLLTVFIPKLSQPAPVVLQINHRSSHSSDPTQDTDYFPVARALARGYAMAVFSVDEVAPDDSSYRNGVINCFYDPDSSLPGNAPSGLGAWAWAASRAVDYMVTDPLIDKNKIAVNGHSRSAKCSSWAGAYETRYAHVVTDDGGVGSAPYRVKYDPNGGGMGRRNWYCGNFMNWKKDNVIEMPVDIHEMLACVAPRHLTVSSARYEVARRPPENELYGQIATQSVLTLLGLTTHGLTDSDWPPQLDTVFYGTGQSYFLNDEGHAVSWEDWDAVFKIGDIIYSESTPTPVQTPTPNQSGKKK